MLHINAGQNRWLLFRPVLKNGKILTAIRLQEGVIVDHVAVEHLSEGVNEHLIAKDLGI